MTSSDPTSPDRFRLLATFIAGRPVDIAQAPRGEAAHTNGQVIFVSADRSAAEHRREVLIQSALLGAGSLDQRLVKALRARPSVARRYLALEGRRVLADLAEQLPLAATLRITGEPSTANADESLKMARARTKVADPPPWFGVIRPSRLLASTAGPGGQATNGDLYLQFDPIHEPETDDEEQSGESKILKLFETPLSIRLRSRSSCGSCSAARVPPGTVLQARTYRFAPFGG